MHISRTITTPLIGPPFGPVGVAVAFGAATGLVPGAVNVICTVGKVRVSVVSVAVKVTGPPCVEERTVNVAFPDASVTAEAGEMVTPARTGLPATVTVLPAMPFPDVSLILAVNVAVKILSAGVEMELVLKVKTNVLLTPPVPKVTTGC